MVFYRKYRPQTIDQLDLTEVREKFTNLLTSSDIPHAFLFTGPKGLGKTSSARILAKAINCTEKKSSKKDHSIEPCNTCAVCTAITAGSHVDVIEIDAASNRGIDEIRELRERVKYAPAELKKKIYIIDEVHMLTTEAFNALLKTLEEPPSHVVFILCTTEEWKIPETVASRTFHVRFEKPTKEELMRSLQRIVTGESLIIENTILEKIYTLSDGAFRNAAKNLEELALKAKDNAITAETLESVFKIASLESHVNELLLQLKSKDMASALNVIQILANNGIDFKVVHEQLVQVLHTQLLNSSSENVKEEQFSIDEIKRLLALINTSYSQLRFSVLPQLPLELVVLEFLTKEKPLEVSESKKLATEETHEVEEQAVQPVTETVQTAPPKRGRPDILARLIESIKQENHSVAGILRSCQLGNVDDSVVSIESRFTFHAERLMEKETKKLLEKHASKILEKPITVEIEIVS